MERQKSCKSIECRKKRRKEAQSRWLEANPGYFNGRYENTKVWREAHPGYQRKWRARQRREIQDEIPYVTPMTTIRLVIPEKILKSEIQDEIRLIRQYGRSFFAAGVVTQDTRQDCVP